MKMLVRIESDEISNLSPQCVAPNSHVSAKLSCKSSQCQHTAEASHQSLDVKEEEEENEDEMLKMNVGTLLSQRLCISLIEDLPRQTDLKNRQIMDFGLFYPWSAMFNANHQ